MPCFKAIAGLCTAKNCPNEHRRLTEAEKASYERWLNKAKPKKRQSSPTAAAAERICTEWMTIGLCSREDCTRDHKMPPALVASLTEGNLPEDEAKGDS